MLRTGMSQSNRSSHCILVVDDEPHLLLKHLSTRTAEETAIPGAADLDGFFALALRELKSSARCVREYAALLEVSLAQELGKAAENLQGDSESACHLPRPKVTEVRPTASRTENRLVGRTSTSSDLRQVAREVRIQAELAARLIDDALQHEGP